METDGQTQTGMTKLTVASPNSANSPKSTLTKYAVLIATENALSAKIEATIPIDIWVSLGCFLA